MPATRLRLVGKEPVGTDSRIVEAALLHYTHKHPKRNAASYREQLYETISEFESILNRRDHAELYGALLDGNHDIVVRRFYAAKLFRSACEFKEFKTALLALGLVRKKYRKEVGLGNVDGVYRSIAKDVSTLLERDPETNLKRLGLLSGKKLREMRVLLRPWSQ